MISEDRGEYLRVDVFDAKMDAFMAEIRLGNEKLRNELRSEIQSVKSELNSKIDGVKTEIAVLNTRMDGLEARMTDLQYSVSWQFTIVAVLVAVIGIIIGAAVAFAPSIWGFIRRAKRPAVSRDDVKNIVSEQMNDALEKYFARRTDLQGRAF